VLALRPPTGDPSTSLRDAAGQVVAGEGGQSSLAPAEEDADQAVEQWEEEPRVNEGEFRDEALDTACWALRAHVKARQGRQYGGVSFPEATDAVMQALEVARGGPTGLAYRKAPVHGFGLCCAAFALVLSVLSMLSLMALTRSYFQEVSVEGGVLLARSVPAFPGEEPIAATAAVFESRPLSGCPGLPVETLLNIRDVVLAHGGVWRSIRVSRVQKYSDAHVVFEAPDGTAVRVNHNEASLRLGSLGDEERIDLSGEHYGMAAEFVIPTVFFEAIAVRSG